MNLCGPCCVLGRPLARFFPHPYFQFDSTTTTCTKCAGDVWCGDEQVWHATGHFSKALFDKCDARCFGRLVTWRLSMGSHLALLRPVLRRVAPRLKHLARGGPRARRVSYTTCVKKHPKRDTDDSHAPHHTSFAVVRRMEMHPRHLLARGTQLH